MKKITLLSVFFLLSLQLKSQDTLTVMTYNLLQYGSTGHSSLAPSVKNPNLKTIINQILPDIFGVNEVSNNSAYCQNILVNVLNQDGRNYYKRAVYSNQTNSSLVNMLFYNSNKVELSNQYFINGGIRDMMLYKLYYKDPNQNPITDSTFIYVCVVHLKAGNTSNDIASRNNETQAVMNYLDNMNLPSNTNLIIMGDMNLYTSSEVAYQNLITHTNTTIRFYDPINRPGGWSDDSNFKDIHTQATRISSEADGGSGGGLDDRFDHILMNQNIINGNNKVKYVPESYKAFGNDGNRFNGAINTSNSVVSLSVANALYSMSDHLPVIAKILINSQQSSVSSNFSSLQWIITPSYLSIQNNYPLIGKLWIYDILGQEVYQQNLTNESTFLLDLNMLKEGVYFVKWLEDSGSIEIKKIIKY